MPYFVIGLLAIFVQAIVSWDVLCGGEWHADESAMRSYRNFLVVVILYNLIDTVWGAFDALHAAVPLYVVTFLYFVAMAFSVLLWTHYVVAYLEGDGTFRRLLLHAGEASFCFQLVALAINLFVPLVFWIDGQAAYHAGPARFANLIMQVVMFLLAGLYSLASASRAHGRRRRRYRAVGIFGVSMAVAVSAQVAFPLMPLYSVGCMLGTCVLHTFVVQDEKDESAAELAEALDRLQNQQAELDSTKSIAYTDALTGVRSKHAHLEAAQEIDRLIVDGEAEPFAVVVFDLNGLKDVNDTQGHAEGDAYLKRACRMICACFKHSPLYRIGGDEFVAVLKGYDYEHRSELIATFVRQMDENRASGDVVVVASGVADYVPGTHPSFQAVFDEADDAMYERKRQLKQAVCTGGPTAKTP